MNIDKQIDQAFRDVFLAASGFALAVIFTWGVVSHKEETKPSQTAYMWACATDMECEQEYFDRFGEWPEDEGE